MKVQFESGIGEDLKLKNSWASSEIFSNWNFFKLSLRQFEQNAHLKLKEA
jgi:hypothetical protein